MGFIYIQDANIQTYEDNFKAANIEEQKINSNETEIKGKYVSIQCLHKVFI